MKRLLVILLAVASLSACVRSIDGYNSDPTVVAALSTYSEQKISIAEFDASMGEGIAEQCRGYSIITTPGKSSLTQYIQDALISELEMANAYSPDSPIVITGKVTQISLSTLTMGEWIIKMTLTSNNGRSLSVKEQFQFKTNIVGESACQVASDVFTYAVQNLLRKVVTAPNFKSLMEASTYPKLVPGGVQQTEKTRMPPKQTVPRAVTPQSVTTETVIVQPVTAQPENASSPPACPAKKPIEDDDDIKAMMISR